MLPVVTVKGDAGEPIETCPGEMTCGNPLAAFGAAAGALSGTLGVAAGGSYCLSGSMPPPCPESEDCSELDLPSASCVSASFIGMALSFCTQPCIPPEVPDAGSTTTGGPSDAGKPTDAGARDAGRTASDASAAADAGRDR
jgi:hypothetical protein